MKNLTKYPLKTLLEIFLKKYGKAIPSGVYLRILFRIKLGVGLNLKIPKTFNEKLQWLKLYDRNPLYTTLVDKYAVKEWVAARIGAEYVTPTYRVWENVDDIDFDSLPERFVLKTNHDSGGIAICRNRAEFDFEAAKVKLKKHLKRNYYWGCREWPYKDVKPLVFAEEYLDPGEKSDLADYKFFCFDGVPRAMFIATERMSAEETKFDFFDMDFNHLPFTNGHPNSDNAIFRPKQFDEMKRLAAALSVGIPHVRVDFYETGRGVLFGEMTFFHWGGFVPFVPAEWDDVFGSWIELPERS